MPWAGSSIEPEFEESSAHLGNASGFVSVTVILQGACIRSHTLMLPASLTCADLKGHLTVEGVLPTCCGWEFLLLEDGPQVGDDTDLQLQESQTVYLRRAPSYVSVTALATSGNSTLDSSRSDDDIYELVLPMEVTGRVLREQIEIATAGALRPVSIFVADGEDAAHAVGDDEAVTLVDEQALIVQRETLAPLVADVQPQVPPPEISAPSRGLFGSLRKRLMGSKAVGGNTGHPTSVRVRSTTNVKVKGATLSCTSKAAWAGCAIFDVPDPAFFELGVKLLANAPSAEADGLTGRWALGVVPLAATAPVKSKQDARNLLQQGYFVTVCHGHPAKLHAPSMAEGTCGEDCPALPGELQKDQTLTIRWAATSGTGTLTVQVDDDDAVALPYAPSSADQVRPCLVFGGKPTEVSVVQLQRVS